MSEIVTSVTAYKNILIIKGCGYEPRENWTPAGEGRIGCVVSNSAKTLGVSPEALDLLRTIKRSLDAIGEVDWWRCTDGTYSFGWLGPHLRLIDPKTAEGSRNYVIGEYVSIENDVPDGAREAIDEMSVQALGGI